MNKEAETVVKTDEQLRLEAYLIATGRNDPPEPHWPSAVWVKTGVGNYALWERITAALAARGGK